VPDLGTPDWYTMPFPEPAAPFFGFMPLDPEIEELTYQHFMQG
jgi:hypothetical protein